MHGSASGLLLVVLALPALAGCASLDEVPSSVLDGKALAVRALPHCPMNGEDRAAQDVLMRDAGEFSAWWNGHCGTPVPAMDFQLEMFAASSTGGHTGHELNIPAARTEAGLVVIDVVETSPGADCAVAQWITYPVAVAAISRAEGQTSFRHQNAVHDCA